MKIVIFGGNGGIGSALVREVALRFADAEVVATWNAHRPYEDLVQLINVRWEQVDVVSESSIRGFAETFDSLHWVINAVGLLHGDAHMPEKSIEQIDPAFFLKNIQINALPTLLVAKHFKRALQHTQSAQFTTVSARVGSIEDNRLGGWHSYRCSKAALNMAIKNISIEWRRTLPNVCVSALHPGTADTSLSEPFQRNVPEGKLFTTEYTAGCLIDQLVNLTPADSGKFLAYDGKEIPW